MSKKLLLLMVPVAGVMSFGLMFAVAWLTRPSPPETPSDQQNQHVVQQQQQQLGVGPVQAATTQEQPVATKTQQRMMSEKMLQDLVHTVKEKADEYDTKLAGLSQEEQRIKMAQATLTKEIDQLESLRVEVADAIANLKSERDKLMKTRITIDQSELENLQKVAKAYAAMKAKASPLLVDLCQDTNSPDGRERFETAVKILYNIDSSTQAKILADMSRQNADIAGMLTMELKRVTEAATEK